MKKRMFVMICILALMLAGCGGGEKEVSGNVTPLETTAPAVADNPVSLGRLEGGVYTNSYIGYGCTLDENWEFYSAEELQELPEMVNEILEGSELAEADGSLDQITDMMAENLTDLTSMNVLYTKVDMQSRIAYSLMTEETVIDSMLEQKDMMISSYAQAGIAVQDMEKVTVTFAGEQRNAVRTSAMIEDVPYYTLQLFDYNLGEYSVTLTLSSYLEDNTDSLLELWYAVE